MTRYIYADALLAHIESYGDGINPVAFVSMRQLKKAISFVEEFTADVVPKSEYDNLKSQYEALDHECDRLERAESNRHDAIEQAKTEVAKEIFVEIENLFAVENFRLICNRQAFAELKKKYTEDQT